MTKRVLVGYATRTDSTTGVAKAIGEALGERGYAVDVRPLREQPLVSDYLGDVQDAPQVKFEVQDADGAWVAVPSTTAILPKPPEFALNSMRFICVVSTTISSKSTSAVGGVYPVWQGDISSRGYLRPLSFSARFADNSCGGEDASPLRTLTGGRSLVLDDELVGRIG